MKLTYTYKKNLVGQFAQLRRTVLKLGKKKKRTHHRRKHRYHRRKNGRFC